MKDIDGGGFDSPAYLAHVEADIQAGFLRKVYAILCIQLCITLGFIALFIYDEDVKAFAQQNSWLFLASVITSIVLICCMGIFQTARRTFPLNYLFLLAFTICESWVMGVISSQYETDAVFLAVCVCAGVTLILTLYALQTTYDFTGYLPYLLVGVLVLILSAIFIPIYRGTVEAKIFGAIGALLYSMFLVYDTQCLLVGSNGHVGVDEYVFAALNLYLDIINLFQMILIMIDDPAAAFQQQGGPESAEDAEECVA